MSQNAACLSVARPLACQHLPEEQRCAAQALAPANVKHKQFEQQGICVSIMLMDAEEQRRAAQALVGRCGTRTNVSSSVSSSVNSKAYCSQGPGLGTRNNKCTQQWKQQAVKAWAYQACDGHGDAGGELGACFGTTAVAGCARAQDAACACGCVRVSGSPNGRGYPCKVHNVKQLKCG
jgi:hypothetical protein